MGAAVGSAGSALGVAEAGEEEMKIIVRLLLLTLLAVLSACSAY